MTWGPKPTEKNALYSSELHPKPIHIHDPGELTASTRADMQTARKSEGA